MLDCFTKQPVSSLVLRKAIKASDPVVASSHGSSLDESRAERGSLEVDPLVCPSQHRSGGRKGKGERTSTPATRPTSSDPTSSPNASALTPTSLSPNPSPRSLTTPSNVWSPSRTRTRRPHGEGEASKRVAGRVREVDVLGVPQAVVPRVESVYGCQQWEGEDGGGRTNRSGPRRGQRYRRASSSTCAPSSFSPSSSLPPCPRRTGRQKCCPRRPRRRRRFERRERFAEGPGRPSR